MILIIAPAIDGLKKWREAAENMGAFVVGVLEGTWRCRSSSILGTMILLFGNAFGAQATAYQLTGGALPLLTLVISSQISGDVLHNLGRLRRRDDDDRDHGRVDWSLHGAPAPLRTVVAFMTSGGTPPPLGPMRRHAELAPRASQRRRPADEPRDTNRVWVIFIAVTAYFDAARRHVPALDQARHQRRPRPDAGLPDGARLAELLRRPALLVHRRILTIVLSLLIIVPTAYWVRLRAPRLRDRRVRDPAAGHDPARGLRVFG